MDAWLATPTPSCFAAVIAHDMGAPVLKVPVPDEEPGVAAHQPLSTGW